MRIGTGVFRGANKAIASHRLGEEYSTDALNCDLRTGALDPMPGFTQAWSVPEGTARIHVWDGHLACFDDADTCVLRHPNSDWLVWLGPGYGQYPRQASLEMFFDGDEVGLPLASARFGVDVPPDAPLVRVNGTAASGAALVRSTSYRFSAVAATGEESGLGLPSDVVDVYVGQEAEVYQLWTGAVPDGVSKIRLYRAESDSYGNTAWMFVAELDADTVAWTDDVEAAEEVAETDGHLPPVGLSGLVEIGNGVVAGWIGRDLWLSEVGVPTSYPVKYRQRAKSAVVGVAVAGGMGVVLTAGVPELLSVVAPESATLSGLSFAADCKSWRSVCTTLYGVAYASSDGLVQISSGGVPTLLTEHLLPREDWLAMDPSLAICVPQDETIFVFFRGRSDGILYHFKRNDLVTLDLGLNVLDAQYDTAGDRVLILDDQGRVGALDGAAMNYVWTSGEWLLARTENFCVARVMGRQSVDNPVALTIFRDGEPHFTRAVTDDRPFSVRPGAFRRVQYRLAGRVRVEAVDVAGDVSEMV